MKNLISQSALIARINRRLKPDDEKLRITRGNGRVRMDLGDFWIHNWRLNLAARTHVDIEDLGRELGVLGDHECLAGSPHLEVNEPERTGEAA